VKIAAKGARELPSVLANHLIVEAIRVNILLASRLPKVIGAWDEPIHEELRSRTAWSPFNALAMVGKRRTTASANGRETTAVTARSPGA
jgi:hypothetical protein